MTGKSKLAALAKSMNTAPTNAPESTSGELVANRPHGDKGDHVKITVTLPPEVYKLINDEAARRKMLKLPNPQLSAVIREAVVEVFSKK